MTFYILDSDHLSLHQRGYEPLGSRLLTIPLEQIAITVISAEELVRGRLAQVRKATKPQERVHSYHWLSNVRLIARKFLQKQGYTVLEAEHTEKAMELLRQYGQRVDLLITDIIMPDISGPKLAAQLTEQYPI